MPRPRMFTIPPGPPFLNELARAVLADDLGLGIDAANPLSIAKATIYLPTRRAATAFAGVMAEEIRRMTGATAALLPRILPLGGLDEADVDLLAQHGWPPGIESSALPPAIGDLRRLLLARQIEQWGKSVNRSCLGLDETRFRLIPERLGEAVNLATNLAELIDTLHSSGVPFARLASLDVSGFDPLWEFTHGFLKIAGEWWPHILEAEAALDPADRRNRLIDAECARIAQGRLEGPVIAAGSTGSVPATARLLGAIAHSAQGAVILPGLDPWLDDASWATLTAPPQQAHDSAISHPQAVMARLIHSMGLARGEIIGLGRPCAVQTARARLASEALRPAETTDLWQSARLHLTDELCALALGHVTLIEAEDEREEALAIALVLREALEEPGATAALVTADRGLAERVAAELARWHVLVDDSAGKPLSRMAPGHLAGLVLELVTSGFSPPVLVALLAHPLLRLGFTDKERRQVATTAEIALMRGMRLNAGLAGLFEALGSADDRIKSPHAPGPLRRVTHAELDLAGQCLERLEGALTPLLALAASSSLDMAALAAAHHQALATLTREEDGTAAAFTGRAGRPLAALLEELAASGAGLLTGDMRDYAEMMGALMQGQSIAPAHRPEARITILGLLEARLLDSGVMVMGGLNEGVWPPEATSDPFLNRAMRQQLGLPVPERRIGQSAHDFAQGLGAARVVLSRALKAGLTQAVPSRFWQRLQAVAPPVLWEQAQQRGHDVLALARQVSQPEAVVAAPRPKPKPPAALQPTHYSVTGIETLYRDPYAIYAKRILKLDKLEPLAQELGARERGTILHEILARFADTWRVALPQNAEAELMAIGRAVFMPLMQEPEVSTFWWPRFERLVPQFLAWEEARRPLLATLATEATSSMELGLADGTSIRLTAKADRIEQLRNSQLAVIDYKTGSMPSDKQIDLGVAAQLTLSAAMARRSGFGTLSAMPVASVAYVSLKGDEKTGLKTSGKDQEKDGLAALAEEHVQRLGEVLMKYRTGAWGFTSRAMPMSIKHAGDYDGLARVKEWSRFAASGEDETGETGDSA